MILSLVILLIIAGVAVFHYVQGFFSATLSALIAVLASVLAIGYHETLANKLLGGQMADQALAITLLGIFAITYIVLRFAFDMLIPGNLRMPLLVDRIGAAVMGVVAGVFATGTVVVAAQTLPFGPSIAGYSRYEIAGDEPVAVKVLGKSQMQDLYVVGKLKPDTIDAPGSGLLIPVDDLVLGVASMLSDGGSLAGDQPIREVHPRYLDELYGQRVGIQVGAKRTMLPDQLSVPAVFWKDQLPQIDGEIEVLRKRGLPANIKPAPDQTFLIVRTIFNKNAGDVDNIVRISTSGVRLFSGGKNYYPIGTLEGGGTLIANRADDALFISVAAQDTGADFVFLVDASVAPAADASGKSSDRVIAPGTFIETKRFARVDLSGKNAPPRVELSPQVQVMRKAEVVAKLRSPEPAK